MIYLHHTDYEINNYRYTFFGKIIMVYHREQMSKNLFEYVLVATFRIILKDGFYFTNDL